MPMEFENPQGLALLLLTVPLLVLYILRVKHVRLRLASVWLWAATERDLQAKTPFRRLIAQVPLVLEALALLLLAVALSSPTSRGGTLPGDHVAIIVDTSASMAGQSPGGERRLDLAKRSAAQLLTRLSPGTDAMLIESGRSPSVAAPLDRDRRRLHDALAALSVRHVEGNLNLALSLAADRLRQLPGKRQIVVVTDQAVLTGTAGELAGIPLSVVSVGEPMANTGVLRLDVRNGRDPATHQPQVQVFALIGNYAERPREVFVTLRQHQVMEPLASRKLQLAPGERAPVVLTFEPAPGDLGTGILVELNPPDGLPIDDRAYGRIPPGRQLPVVFSPPQGNTWIRRALEADPEVTLTRVALDELGSGGAANSALVVTDGLCPPNDISPDLLILNPPVGPCAGLTIGAELKSLNITSWATSDPRLRFLNLDGVQVARARGIELDRANAALVKTREGAVIADASSPGHSTTVVSFDVGDSNWPLQSSFVLFVRNLVEIAREHRMKGITGTVRTGEPVSVRVPADVTELQLVLPNGQTAAIPARQGLAVVPDTRESGFYHLSWKGRTPGSTILAANLAGDGESDLQGKQRVAATGRTAAGTSATPVQSQAHWAWLGAAGALLLIVLDVMWWTRRPRSADPSLLPRLPERTPARQVVS